MGCARFHDPTMSKLMNLDELFSGRRFNREGSVVCVR